MYPGKSLHLKKEKCTGGNQSKVRITGMAGSIKCFRRQDTNVCYQKIINPRCFKGVKKKPCRYCAQKKVWINVDLFEEWVRELDRKFQRENRKIALIVDNCPTHSEANDIKAIELVFVPPNTTSYTQTMDQGVTWSLKSK